jgi:hypothetical protein
VSRSRVNPSTLEVGTWIEPYQPNGKRYRVVEISTESKGVFLRSEGGRNRRYVSNLALALLWEYSLDQEDREEGTDGRA